MIKVGLVSGGSSLLGLQMAAFWLCLHMAERERERARALVSSYKVTKPIMRTPSPMTSSSLDYLPKAPSPHWRLGLKHMNGGRGESIERSLLTFCSGCHLVQQ